MRIPIYLVRDGSIKTEKKIVDSPDRVATEVRKLIGNTPKEHFVLAMLDSRKKLLGLSIISIGTLSSSLVHPREVFQVAILGNAAAIVIAHNHPSGDSNPGQEDKDVTRRIKQAGELLGIPLMDHIIIGSVGNYFSFKEKGFL